MDTTASSKGQAAVGLSRPLRWGEEAITDVVDESRFVLPTGTVTLLLADIEGSAGLWESQAEAMPTAIARHDELIAETLGRFGGVRPRDQGEGDSFIAAFSRPSDAVACALALQLAFADEDWRDAPLKLRIAVHTGEVRLRDEGNYIGHTVNRCARIRDLGHGGQTLVSQVTFELVADRLPDEALLTDLGTHRLRDLARPERIHQLRHPRLRDEFPPLRSLDALPNNLPAQLTSFVGRQREMSEVKELLGGTRMLTLTGTGGSGKTRLALQVAADVLEEFPDGVWVADLSSTTDASLTARAIATALRLGDEKSRSATDLIVHYIGSQRMLLVLDNCEHLVEACAEIADALLKACRSLSILATSREPFGVAGETPWQVPPLSLPDENHRQLIDALPTYDAIALFIDRATKSRPNFRVTNENAPAVAEVCQRLDGIPLAIELAAARVHVLTPEQIVEGLHDRFRLLTGGKRVAVPRQQTLQASVDWSYELLTNAEKVVFRRLSVFVGGCTLDAAESVCSGDGIASNEVLDLVSHLVDKSLVVVDEAEPASRYRLLETMRQYARDRLVEAGELEAVTNRHLDFFVEFAKGAEPTVETVLSERLAVTRADYQNVRAALLAAVEKEDATQLLTLTGVMWWYWANESTTEGRRWLEAALARAEGGEALLRGRVLLGIAQLAMILGDLMVIPQYANEALALYRDIDNRRGVAYALQLLGIFATFIDYATARRHLEESLELARTLDDSLLLWSDLFWLGYGCVLNDDFADARTYLEESLTVAQRRSSPEAIAQSNSWLGFGAWMQGDLARARAHYEDAIAVSDAAERVGALYLLGQTLAFLGEYAAARSVTEEALVTSREVFEPTLWGEPIALWNMAMIDQFEGRSRESRETVERAIAMLGPMTPPRIQAQLRFTLAEADLGVGAIADARAHANEAEGLLANSNRSSRAWLELTKAKIDRAEGEYASAEAHAHEALALTHAVGTLPYTVHALEVIAGLAAAQQSFREATRVYAAAERVRNEIGFVRPPVERGAYDASVAAARAAIGKDFDEAWAEGAAMSMDEAVAYARRGRGERKRPSSGWAALTPTELEVSRLVAQGLKNAEIAERMFISVNTVETHLKHVFTKLSLSSRTELALEAARQNSPAS